MEKIAKWQKIQIGVTIFQAVITIFLGLIGYYLNDAIKEREIKVKYVEIAINILKETPRKEEANLRSWAVQVLNQYSSIRLNDGLQKELINEIRLNAVISAVTASGKATVELQPVNEKQQIPK